MSPCTREIGDLDHLRVVISGMERESLNRRATNRAFQWALDALKDQSRRARLYPTNHPLRALQRGPGNANFGHRNRSVCCPPLMNDLMMMTAAVGGGGHREVTFLRLFKRGQVAVAINICVRNFVILERRRGRRMGRRRSKGYTSCCAT